MSRIVTECASAAVVSSVDTMPWPGQCFSRVGARERAGAGSLSEHCGWLQEIRVGQLFSMWVGPLGWLSRLAL